MNLLQKIKQKLKNSKQSEILNTKTVNEIIEEIHEGFYKKKYSSDIEEIHHEFESASDKLLLEASNIIKEAKTKDINKVNRLQSLGFKQANQVTELVPLIEKVNLSKEQIELISYYKFHYPNNKFITEEQVKYICHKYNLVCGDISRFRGFVPEKNLREIENFTLKESDERYYRIFKIQKYGINPGHFSYDELSKEEYIKQSNSLDWRMDSNYTFIKLTPLQICAPVKDMDISGLELEDGYKLTKKHIPDPVVLQPVKGGYLILTAWGDEAEDPIVVNNNFN